MNPGKLDRIVEIQAMETTTNDYGDEIKGWSTIAEAWAHKQPMTARELFAAQQINTEITDKFIIRYLGQLTPKHRLIDKHTGQKFDIKSVQEIDGRKNYIQILATVHIVDDNVWQV